MISFEASNLNTNAQKIAFKDMEPIFSMRAFNERSRQSWWHDSIERLSRGQWKCRTSLGEMAGYLGSRKPRHQSPQIILKRKWWTTSHVPRGGVRNIQKRSWVTWTKHWQPLKQIHNYLLRHMKRRKEVVKKSSPQLHKSHRSYSKMTFHEGHMHKYDTQENMVKIQSNCLALSLHQSKHRS